MATKKKGWVYGGSMPAQAESGYDPLKQAQNQKSQKMQRAFELANQFNNRTIDFSKPAQQGTAYRGIDLITPALDYLGRPINATMSAYREAYKKPSDALAMLNPATEIAKVASTPSAYPAAVKGLKREPGFENVEFADTMNQLGLKQNEANESYNFFKGQKGAFDMFDIINYGTMFSRDPLNATPVLGMATKAAAPVVKNVAKAAKGAIGDVISNPNTTLSFGGMGQGQQFSDSFLSRLRQSADTGAGGGADSGADTINAIDEILKDKNITQSQYDTIARMIQQSPTGSVKESDIIQAFGLAPRSREAAELIDGFLSTLGVTSSGGMGSRTFNLGKLQTLRQNAQDQLDTTVKNLKKLKKDLQSQLDNPNEDAVEQAKRVKGYEDRIAEAEGKLESLPTVISRLERHAAYIDNLKNSSAQSTKVNPTELLDSVLSNNLRDITYMLDGKPMPRYYATELYDLIKRNYPTYDDATIRQTIRELNTQGFVRQQAAPKPQPVKQETPVNQTDEVPVNQAEQSSAIPEGTPPPNPEIVSNTLDETVLPPPETAEAPLFDDALYQSVVDGIKGRTKIVIDDIMNDFNIEDRAVAQAIRKQLVAQKIINNNGTIAKPKPQASALDEEVTPPQAEEVTPPQVDEMSQKLEEANPQPKVDSTAVPESAPFDVETKSPPKFMEYYPSVLDLLKKNGKITTKEIEKAFKVSSKQAGELRKKLLDEGHINNSGKYLEPAPPPAPPKPEIPEIKLPSRTNTARAIKAYDPNSDVPYLMNLFKNLRENPDTLPPKTDVKPSYPNMAQSAQSMADIAKRQMDKTVNPDFIVPSSQGNALLLEGLVQEQQKVIGNLRNAKADAERQLNNIREFNPDDSDSITELTNILDDINGRISAETEKLFSYINDLRKAEQGLDTTDVNVPEPKPEPEPRPEPNPNMRDVFYSTLKYGVPIVGGSIALDKTLKNKDFQDRFSTLELGADGNIVEKRPELNVDVFKNSLYKDAAKRFTSSPGLWYSMFGSEPTKATNPPNYPTETSEIPSSQTETGGQTNDGGGYKTQATKDLEQRLATPEQQYQQVVNEVVNEIMADPELVSMFQQVDEYGNPMYDDYGQPVLDMVAVEQAIQEQIRQ